MISVTLMNLLREMSTKLVNYSGNALTVMKMMLVADTAQVIQFLLRTGLALNAYPDSILMAMVIARPVWIHQISALLVLTSKYVPTVKLTLYFK